MQPGGIRSEGGWHVNDDPPRSLRVGWGAFLMPNGAECTGQWREGQLAFSRLFPAFFARLTLHGYPLVGILNLLFWGLAMVAIVGSRTLPGSWTELVAEVCDWALAQGGVVTGCASGADLLVRQCCPSALVLRAGDFDGPLAQALAARTRAVVARASVAVVALGLSPGSRGTLLACRCAVRQGLPVVAFPLLASHLLPSLGFGSWSAPSPGPGWWAGSCRWVPAQSDLF